MKLTTVEEKSLALAELMRWEMQPLVIPNVCAYDEWRKLRPYEPCEVGRAQFAAILLKFPEVMTKATYMGKNRSPALYVKSCTWYFELSQENILDEILRMNGYEVE